MKVEIDLEPLPQYQKGLEIWILLEKLKNIEGSECLGIFASNKRPFCES